MGRTHQPPSITLDLVPSLKRLLAALRRLPGIGVKSAQRIGYHLLRADEQQALDLARAIVNLTRRVGLCSICGNTAEVGRSGGLENGVGAFDDEGRGAGTGAEGARDESDVRTLICDICADPERDHSRLLVVEEPYNVEAFERTGVYEGYYHVLGGLFDPLAGIGAEELRLDSLIKRLRHGGIREVILATSPTSAGEATASYLRELLEPLDCEITRIAVGLSAGADVDYADEVSLRMALEGRRHFK